MTKCIFYLSFTEEAEIESVSEVDSSASAPKPDTKEDEAADTPEDPLHRLSISSEASEIMANLVEDRPYQSPEPKEETTTNAESSPQSEESS